MEQAIEERGDGRGIAEELAPILHGPVRGDEGRGALIAAHDDLEEILTRGGRELTHAEVVDDEQGHGGELDEVGLPRAAELLLDTRLDMETFPLAICGRQARALDRASRRVEHLAAGL